MNIYITTEPNQQKLNKSNEVLFTTEQYNQLSTIMSVKKFTPGRYLFWEGDEANSIYWIRKGKIKLRKTSSDGKELLVSILRPGDLFADIDAYDTSYRCSAEAMDEVEAGIIPRLQFELMLSQSADLSLRFAMWMSLQQRRSESKLRDLLLSGKNGAIASVILRLSNSFGLIQPDGIVIDIKLTHSELADLAGTTREGVNRTLSTLKKEQTLSIEPNGCIKILKLDTLRKMAGCPDCTNCPPQLCRI